MKTISLLGGFVLLTTSCLAQDFQQFAGYQLDGKTPNAVADVYRLVYSPDPNSAKALEEGLIGVISSGTATLDAKAFACRMLATIGSEKCVPAAASLLGDETLSTYARIPLEGINSPACREALRKALPKVKEEIKPGIISALAACRDESAIPLLAEYAAKSSSLRPNAIRALGTIGGAKAAEALLKIKVTPEIQRAYSAALTSCAATLPPKAAASLCENILLGGDEVSKAAALALYAQGNPVKAIPYVTKWLQSEKKTLEKAAVGVLASPSADSKLVGAAVAKLKELPPSGRAGVLVALGAHGDRQYLKLVEPWLEDPEKSVSEGAIEAAGKLGSGPTVDLLLANKNPLAIDALVNMGGSEVEPRLLAGLGNPAFRDSAAKALAGRRSRASVPVFLKAAAGDDPEYRAIAWRSLKVIAPGDQIAEIWQLSQTITDPKEKNVAFATLRAVCAKAEDRNASFKVMAGFYPAASEPVKKFILDLGAISGTPVALELAQDALNSGAPSLRAQAIQALSVWSNPSAAPLLLELAKSAPADSERILGLRGYIRCAGLEDLPKELSLIAKKKYGVAAVELSTEERAVMFVEASKLVTRNEEKLLILGDIRAAKTETVLPILFSYLADEAVRKEAELAAVDILERLRKKVSPEVRRMAELLSKSSDAEVARKAQRTLEL